MKTSHRLPRESDAVQEFASLDTSSGECREARNAIEIERACDYVEAIIETVPPLLILDENLRVQMANESFFKCFKTSPDETVNRLVYELGNGQWNIPTLRTLLEKVLPQRKVFKDIGLTHEFERIGRCTMLLSGRQVEHFQRILLSIQVISEQLPSQAAGCLMKATTGNDSLQATREIAGGNAFFSPPVAKLLLKQWRERFFNGWPVRSEAARLTSRQAEVLQLIAEGYANKQIAGSLSVSTKTVEKHRQEIMNKLNIHNIAMLTRYAVSIGVVGPTVRPNWPAISALRTRGSPSTPSQHIGGRSVRATCQA